ncbi:serine--tRNA ligase [Candidatus Purcelliella pentastirinorum]|uniref:serine--tRNA ligase n=1 Tax=Candidatus Purcelliella pentastirinorum TaxID=472834 RepID=UPI002368871F|nr:serine--tRNA ligase [Candidatus Purcelliella pentastirinorum]WDI78806.1 serine--tRNA ligase [Candidatus Purcelliella pentastirinorum]WDR79939.1 serine--tRNA ligase [Candidatus Purcelliella pentastirinorum]
MIDLKKLKKNKELFKKKLNKRGFILDVNKLITLEKKRKKLQKETENLQHEHNIISKKKKINQKFIFNIKKIKKNNIKIKSNKIKLNKIKDKITKLLIKIPNLPADDIPIGKLNKEITKWGNKPKIKYKILDHIKLGEFNNWFDIKKANKISGSRFVIIKGKLAKLHRALSQFMLNLHINEHGYKEIYVPYLTNNNCLYGTGQLPKFDKDLFHIKKINEIKISKKYTLIPTGEVPLTNLYRETILEKKKLPIKLTTHTPCFRLEAGSYGKKNKGLIRTHQFDKVELVQIVESNKSNLALEEITSHAEKILKMLILPYRKVLLCSKEMGFCATKTYDLEVWFPSNNTYCEVSSCSNMLDFQARRIKTRYKNKFKKIEFVHTLNASGLAIGRTLAAIMENYQQKDKSIKIPDVLKPYMNYINFID